MSRNARDDLSRRLRALLQTRTKVESLHAGGSIARRDVERVYEGLYIAAVTSFEGFLEALFFDVLLNGDRYSGSIHARVEFKSAQVLRAFVLGGRPYVNWLPYDRTNERAAIYLRAGRPFSNANATDKRMMANWMTMRHAIAHTSRHADRTFQRQVVGNLALPPRQRSPAGYLRSQLRPQVTRFENVLREMETIAAKLS